MKTATTFVLAISRMFQYSNDFCIKITTALVVTFYDISRTKHKYYLYPSRLDGSCEIVNAITGNKVTIKNSTFKEFSKALNTLEAT